MPIRDIVNAALMRAYIIDYFHIYLLLFFYISHSSVKKQLYHGDIPFQDLNSGMPL
jgi:hypothetical protein